MNTLSQAPVAPLLERLWVEADASKKEAMEALAKEDKEHWKQIMKSKTAYVELYTRFKNLYLSISPETGKLLYMLARTAGARHVVEFGTSFGVSTIHLAAAVRDNIATATPTGGKGGEGGESSDNSQKHQGKVITTEFEPSKAARARANLTEAGLIDIVEIREGDALQTLGNKADLPPAIDLVLLDGAKSLYLDILNLIQDRLHVGSMVIADNANSCAEYVDYVRAPKGRFMSLPFAKDVELSVFLG
eukprot:TRINITY_DN3695_c0_g1_i2.p1 TRINITY_DN3695_c0_g1~~TRINITY_DN3695_c0_g1_i2.p1  ORF type:complete len:247 (-),score=60.91 TRINITY_DN3695_c0_g1_i2:93-833(-)